MLTEILSSDKILQKGSDKNSKSLSNIGEQSEHFSKILKSLDKGGVGDSPQSGTTDIMDNLKAIFEDDKEFLKESISFLNQREKEPKLLDVGDNLDGSDKISSLLGLNFGNYKALKSEGAEESKFRILINKAKEFLRSELMKHSVSEKDMPKTLRGLVELASSKGISLKNIKFSLDDKDMQVSQTDSQIGDSSRVAKFIINQHSTESLLRSKKEVIVLRTKKNQMAENLSDLSSKVDESPSLKSLLSLDTRNTSEKTDKTGKSVATSEKGGINLLNQPKGLGDILKAKDELKLDDKKVSKNLKAHEKITQFTGVSKEMVVSLFSDDELKDLGIDAKLLKSENDEIDTTSSEQHTATIKNEQIKSGLELKISEAKTMTRHLAMNLREQVENYKHPFQKLTLSLNPQHLGEVEVDIIKRGKSVKITLSGTTNTIGILSANSGELRNQLINVGLQDPSFKFNEDGRNGSQHQQRDGRGRDDEVDEEKRDNFEIDVLQYV